MRSVEPTLAQVMRRPKWILALFLALAVAATFAGLAQWQMGSAVMLEQNKLDTETVTPIGEVTKPQTAVTDESGARMLSLNVSFVDSDTVAIGDRMNFGEKGAWVVTHAVQEDTGAHLALALGWLPDFQEAKEYAENFRAEGSLSIEGRYLPQEGVKFPAPGDELYDLYTLSVGQLINLWQPFDGDVYPGYLVLKNAPEGLEEIESHPPLPQETINWLNLFYAIEWAVFAGFAVFFWYRLARDAWEKELEIKALNE